MEMIGLYVDLNAKGQKWIVEFSVVIKVMRRSHILFCSGETVRDEPRSFTHYFPRLSPI